MPVIRWYSSKTRSCYNTWAGYSSLTIMMMPYMGRGVRLSARLVLWGDTSMKRNALGRSKSIYSVLLRIFFMITVIIILGFSVSFFVSRKITNEYRKFDEVNARLHEITMMITQCEALYNQYTREKTIESYKAFKLHSELISDNIESIRQEVKEHSGSLAYLRTLKNMNEYQLEAVGQLWLPRNNALAEDDYEEMLELAQRFGYMKIQAQSLMISYMDYSHFKYSELLERLNNIQLIVHLGMFAMAIGSIGTSLVLSRGVIVKIRQISDAAQKLAESDWEIDDIKSEKYVELTIMAQAFNKMKHHIRTYIEELKYKADLEKLLAQERISHEQADRLLKEAELQTLQMQMNPHFLFNTLNMIKRVVLMKEKQIAVNLIDAISTILRYNMDNKGRLVPLSEEITALESYILIQQVRFQDKLTVILDKCEHLGDTIVPPMILQPLVENAIVHGLKDKSYDGVLRINIKQNETSVIVTIEDNGTGFDEITMRNIMRSHRGERHGSIGIYNVKDRLALHFGSKSAFAIANKSDGGSIVTMVIPRTGVDQC